MPILNVILNLKTVLYQLEEHCVVSVAYWSTSNFFKSTTIEMFMQECYL